jgi:hypothetical protein
MKNIEFRTFLNWFDFSFDLFAPSRDGIFEYNLRVPDGYKYSNNRFEFTMDNQVLVNSLPA